MNADIRSWDRLVPLLCLSLVGLPLLTASCRGNETGAPPAAPAVKVTSPVTEATLTTVTLTAEAEARLGIETAAIEQRVVTRTRMLGGEVVPAGGAETTVAAPFAGTLEAAPDAPLVGTSVRRGTTIFRLVPFAPAERDVRVEAERAVSEAAGRQGLAATRAMRSTRLAADGSGSRRAAEEAQADLVVANATLTAAQDRLALAARGVTASGAIALDAPFDAVLRAVHAGPGQTVAAAAPLFDLVRLDTVWIRVPLYAGDIDAIDRRAPARFVPLGSASDAPGSIARPVSAPPSADASTAAVDLYYAVPNTVTAAAARDTASLRPGQRLGVRVPLVSDTTSLVAPRAALLHDAYGGTWVYETTGAHVFTRRRVSVVDLVGDLAVLAVLPQGPALGTRVVTVGAAELFGTEFGAGK